MQINNKILIIVLVIIIILIMYLKHAKNDISRYKNIIDTYMSENTSGKKSAKKVQFKLPNDKSSK